VRREGQRLTEDDGRVAVRRSEREQRERDDERGEQHPEAADIHDSPAARNPRANRRGEDAADGQ
jgi:hypothetical protein